MLLEGIKNLTRVKIHKFSMKSEGVDIFDDL